MVIWYLHGGGFWIDVAIGIYMVEDLGGYFGGYMVFGVHGIWRTYVMIGC